jgi:predicted kinase
MHCGNVIIEDGVPILFDAIEFNEELAIIDVLYDLAFLLMDLMRFGQRQAAGQLLNDYLDQQREEEDLSGLIALPMFMATRAGVRALVAADLARELPKESRVTKVGEARSYFDACLSYLEPVKTKLVCIGGLSGTGKSSLAMRLAPKCDPPPGAILIRSDVERKRLSGVGLTERLPPSAYSSEASRQVYASMFARAKTALKAGYSVVLDAVFLLESERNAARDLATNLDIVFKGFWLEAGHAVERQRILNRVGDASDATVSVLEKQSNIDVGQVGWLRVDATGTVEQTLEQVVLVL